MFRHLMRRILLICLLSLAARAELKDRIAAVVNGQPITLTDVEDRVAPELARLPAGPAGEAQRKQVIHQGLQSLIDERLVESEATSLGIDIGEDELQRLVDQLARQNSMDTAQFREALAQQGVTMDTVRDTLKRQQLMVRLLQYKVKPRKVSDAEVQGAYATMNKEAELEVRARDIYVASPDGASQARQDAARDKAETAMRRVRAGESFAKVARDLSEGPAAREGGDLGYVRRGQMLPAIEKAAFEQETGGVSLVRTTGEHGGFHLVMVEDKRKLPPRPLAEVQEEIRNKLANDSIFKEREHYLAQLRKTAHVDEKL
jgi:peptidyl-prolyl cis-trans isomerase SurA